VAGIAVKGNKCTQTPDISREGVVLGTMNLK